MHAGCMPPDTDICCFISEKLQKAQSRESQRQFLQINHQLQHFLILLLFLLLWRVNAPKKSEHLWRCTVVGGGHDAGSFNEPTLPLPHAHLPLPFVPANWSVSKHFVGV